jgi:hypothetical protein
VHQVDKATADQRLGLVAEDPLHRRADIADGSIGADDHDDVRSVLDEGAEAALLKPWAVWWHLAPLSRQRSDYRPAAVCGPVFAFAGYIGS